MTAIEGNGRRNITAGLRHPESSNSTVQGRPLADEQQFSASSPTNVPIGSRKGQRLHSRHNASGPAQGRDNTKNEAKATWDDISASPPSLWNPIWLSKTILGIFIAVFVLLAVTLIVLYIVSLRNLGLVTQHQKLRYMWKYVPTAVFALVASMWMRVDHWCKVLTPFQRMREKATAAKQGVLQDYLSPLNVVTLVRSLRDGDLAVSLVVLVSILLQISVVLSTSLFFLEPQQTALSTNLPVSRSFVQSAPNLLYRTIKGDTVSRFSGMAIGRIPYSATASHDIAIESFFQNTSSQDYVSYSAIVVGISSTLDCHPLNIGNTSYLVNGNSSITVPPRFAIDIELPDCILKGVPIGVGLANGAIHTATTTSYQGWWGNFTCNSSILNYQWPNFVVDMPIIKPIEKNLTERRTVFITSTVQWTPLERGKNNTRERHTWVQNFTGITCKPSYSIDDYAVTYFNHNADRQEPFHAVKRNNSSRKINNVTNDDLPSIVYVALANSLLFEKPPSDGKNVTVDENTGYLPEPDKFYLIMSQLNGNSTIAAFLNQSALLEYAPKAFAGITTQVFDQYFTTPISRNVSAEYIVLKERLVLRTLTLSLMVSILTLVAFSTVAMLFVRPIDAVPQEPQSISSRAKFLAGSTEFERTLHATNGPDLGTMERVLSQKEFRIQLPSTAGDFNLAICENTYIRNRYLVPPGSKPADHIWWRPITSSIWFMCLLPTLTLLIIVSLELLQRLSDSRDGIADCQEWDGKYILTTIVPAAIMTAVVLAFRNLDFNTSLAAPFLALNQSPKSYKQGLNVALVGRPSVFSLYLAIRHSLVLPIFSTSAAVVGSFLTVVVSGLYYTESVPSVLPATLQQTDELKYTYKDLSVSDNFAGTTTSLIYYGRSLYPANTYGQLVFPSFRLHNMLERNTSLPQLTVQVPALRPKIDCITIDPSHISYQTQIGLVSMPLVARLTAFVELPCFENMNATGRVLNCQYPWQMEMPLTTTPMTNQYVAGIQTTAASTAYAPADGIKLLNITNQPKLPLAKDFPSLLYYFGTVNTQKTNSTLTIGKASINGALCFQRIDEVQSKLTLNLPELTISTSTPPQVLENTSRPVELKYGQLNSSSYVYSLSTLLSSLVRNNSDVTTTTLLGPFFWALVNGPTYRNPQEFFAQSGRPLLQAAVNNLYSTYIVQVLNANFRYNITANKTALNQTQYSPLLLATQTEFKGEITNPMRQRLKQHSGSKIALQVMLSVMTLCAVVVFCFSGTKAFLPHNPCTIAGGMFLLAGSEMTTRKLVPPGSERNGSSKLWNGWFFSLGWWGTQENPRFGIDFGMAEKMWNDLPTGQAMRALVMGDEHAEKTLESRDTSTDVTGTLYSRNKTNTEAVVNDPVNVKHTPENISNWPKEVATKTTDSETTSSADLSDIFQGYYTSSIDQDNNSHRSRTGLTSPTEHRGPGDPHHHNELHNTHFRPPEHNTAPYSFSEGDDHSLSSRHREQQRREQQPQPLDTRRDTSRAQKPSQRSYPEWI